MAAVKDVIYSAALTIRAPNTYASTGPDIVIGDGETPRPNLDLVGGEVAFPTLYDPFFTAARQDFEQEVAETALLVARFLLREGDRPGATALTARAAELFPDHPEQLRFDEKVKWDEEQESASAISSPASTTLRP